MFAFANNIKVGWSSVTKTLFIRDAVPGQQPQKACITGGEMELMDFTPSHSRSHSLADTDYSTLTGSDLTAHGPEDSGPQRPQ